MIWPTVLGASAACYALKLAGLSVPHRVLENRRVQRIAAMLPVALLAALVATQTFTTGARLAVDARAAGLLVAVLAVILRAPFLVVVAVGAAVAAVIRLIH